MHKLYAQLVRAIGTSQRILRIETLQSAKDVGTSLPNALQSVPIKFAAKSMHTKRTPNLHRQDARPQSLNFIYKTFKSFPLKMRMEKQVSS